MTAELISIAQARERVLQAVAVIGTERVPSSAALSRVLREDVRATSDIPPFASSAMDGYALSAGEPGRTFTVIGESRAGSPATQALADGEAIRISTGAAVPDGASAVARQEDVETQSESILVKAALRSGENIRGAGEVMRAGTVALEAGAILGAAHLAAAIAAGAGEVTVARRPRVEVLATGDELRAPGEALGPGEIHNSNGPMLVALAAQCGALTSEPRVLPDDRAATQTGLGSALERADVLLVSGGVSVGPHDHVKPALAELGVEERFWGVALQPGKPTWFGERDGKLVFGLPGNPVSAYVTFVLFARPALAALQGASPSVPASTEAALGEPVRRNPRRQQALRVRLAQRDGTTVAIPNGPQGSHVVTSLIGADALALIPSGTGVLDAGARVALEPL